MCIENVKIGPLVPRNPIKETIKGHEALFAFKWTTLALAVISAVGALSAVIFLPAMPIVAIVLIGVSALAALTGLVTDISQAALLKKQGRKNCLLDIHFGPGPD